MMIPDRASEKVTIEDLLRVKRAERPSPEFWAHFEKDLRAKQLAAIIEKRPWWHALHLPQAARVVARFQVPAGAAAIFALSFVVVNQYRMVEPGSMVSSQSDVSAPPAHVPAKVALAAAPAASPAVIVAAAVVEEVNTAKMEAKPEVAADAQVAPQISMVSDTVASKSAELTSMIPWGVGPAEEDTVSTRLLKTNLEIASDSEDLSVASLLGKTGTKAEQVVQTSQPQIAEVKAAVAQVSSPRELRRAKVLAGLVLADNAESSEYAKAIRGRDVAVNDLNDAQLYDSARRLGMGGDRFTLKF